MTTLTFESTRAPRMDQPLDLAALRANKSRLRYGPSRHAILETLSYHRGPPVTFTQLRASQPDWMFKIARDSGWEYRAMRLMSNLGLVQRYEFEGRSLSYWAITSKGRSQLRTWNDSGFNNARSFWSFARQVHVHYVRNGDHVTRDNKWVHGIDARTGDLHSAWRVEEYAKYHGAQLDT